MAGPLKQTVQQIPEGVKNVGDALGIGTIVGAFMGWLPEIAAGLTVIWTAIRIYETKTVQNWVARRKK